MEEKIDLKKFTVFFHGKFIPLQGVPYIIRAAKFLESNRDIVFKIVGKGQTYQEVVDLIKQLKVGNVELIGRVSIGDLPSFLRSADVCLGVFGDTGKAERVIPNKVYESVAMRKPVITADTPAVRELFTHKKDIFLCKRADPQSIVDAILELKNNVMLRNKIAEGGYEVFRTNAVPGIIGKEVCKCLEDLLKKTT